VNDLLVGLGLVLVFEGLLWGAAPQLARRFLQTALITPERTMRIGGWTAVAAGLVLVWLIRG
jgi:uncharacterized protein YjeT (DUF2065 family)